MHNGRPILDAWKKFSAFEVFGDYSPMSGFRLVVAIGARPEALEGALEGRAPESDLLDPVFARWMMRAGLGLMQSGLVSFAYATCEETVCVVRPEALQGSGAPMKIQAQLATSFTARLSLLAGRELPAVARIYEFPDVSVIRRAVVKLAEDVEEATPLRSSLWLGAQLRGRGQSFHPSMLETLEEQTSLLQSNGIDMDALPTWWWRGVAAGIRGDGGVEVFDDLPQGEALGELIPE